MWGQVEDQTRLGVLRVSHTNTSLKKSLMACQSTLRVAHLPLVFKWLGHST